MFGLGEEAVERALEDVVHSLARGARATEARRNAANIVRGWGGSEG